MIKKENISKHFLFSAIFCYAMLCCAFLCSSMLFEWLFVLGSCVVYPWLTSNSLCIPRRIKTCNNPPLSTSKCWDYRCKSSCFLQFILEGWNSHNSPNYQELYGDIIPKYIPFINTDSAILNQMSENPVIKKIKQV